MAAKREMILDAAEKRMRAVGYNAVSFRDLAQDVGVKSASIHYHFQQKKDLGACLVERYSDRFSTQLEDIDTSNLVGAISEYVELYFGAFKIGQSVCLCAILGAEAMGLPNEVKTQIHAFFQINVDWLTKLHRQHSVPVTVASPWEIVASLEGAMIVAVSTSQQGVFDSMAKRLVDVHR